MTQFEADRMQDAFDFLLDKEEDSYKTLLTSDDPKEVNKAHDELGTYERLLWKVEETLRMFGVYEGNNPELREKVYNDPTFENHNYLFRVTFVGADEEEDGFTTEQREYLMQEGQTKELAAHYLETHIKFDHCNDKSFKDLKIEFMYQLF